MVGWHHQLDGHEFEQAPGDAAGQGGLVCCSPWGCKESDTTERLNNSKIVVLYAVMGEGNGDPLQRSCLENPREGGAWWAAFYGVAQNRTRLK